MINILKFFPKKIKTFTYNLIYSIYKLFRNKKFNFYSQSLLYENSFYNTSFFNERTVEIPIFKELISKYKSDSVLEVGNVLNHYNFVKERDIVDKYEIFPKVKNIDIEHFNSTKKYNLILSISTLEHVGLDEGEIIQDPEKLSRCLRHLSENLLQSKGCLIVSLPVNYKENVDDIIFNSNFFTEKFFMIRDNYFLNTWKLVDFKNLKRKIRKKPMLIEEVFFGVCFKN